MTQHTRRGQAELRRRREGALERLGCYKFALSKAKRKGTADEAAWAEDRLAEVARVEALLKGIGAASYEV